MKSNTMENGHVGILELWLFLFHGALAIDLHTSEVFIKRIDPTVFDWTQSSSSKGFQYRSSLANKPDLPSWLSYIYSQRHQAGFIFGVPPSNQNNLNIDVIGLNKETYETRHKVIHLNITEKTDMARYEVHLKVDNLNVQDMFDPHRLQRLLNVFTQILWKSSKDDLHVTFLESAIKMGARLPLRPHEGEGVIIQLGSVEEFSEELLNLQEEIRPLYKLSHCPRDLKRTSVNVHFTSQGFLLDWCKFRLIRKMEVGESGNAEYSEPSGGAREKGSSRLHRGGQQEASDLHHPTGLPELALLPARDYRTEALTTLIVPILALLVLTAFLSFVLCLQHDSLDDPISDDFFELLFEMCEEYGRGKKLDDELTLAQYEAVQRATDSLRSMDQNRSTEPSPRLTSEGVDACRPNPPPYSATRRIVGADS